MSKKLKIGIIGLGSISDLHINSYLNNPKAELYAFCDIIGDRAREKAKLYNVAHVFTDYKKMLELPELDAVSICTWNEQHAPCTIAALNAGKNVLCEKPTAMSVDEAIEMKKAADKNNKLLMIGFVKRYGNDCEALKKFIDQDFLGDIYYAKAVYLRKIGNPGGWFGNKSLSGGGPLIDLGVHFIDLIKYVIGNPKAVSVYGATFDKLGNRNNIKGKKIYKSASATDNDICDVEDLASAMIRFDNGAVLHIETSFSLHTKEAKGEMELFGTKGGAKLDSTLKLYTEMNDYMTDIALDVDSIADLEGAFQAEIDHFISCMTDNTICKSPIEDGVDIMKILDAVYKSAKSGHEVVLEG
ncbi:MAG: Gfo/Idh/MocA family oxidoreductase [Firmicutes bacterium]|nr:Gfo/Idh/MocA family oxidoreductase [Bacillota bacterium]